MSACAIIPLYDRAGDVVATALVDLADAPAVRRHRWRRSHYGYAVTGSPTRGTVRLMHRMLLGLAKGDPLQADHRNGDRLDCRRANLRVVTNAQNAQNQAAKGGTSRHGGVSRRRDTGRWVGYVKVNYVRHSAGCYATEAEAVAAVKALRALLMPYDEPARHE